MSSMATAATATKIENIIGMLVLIFFPMTSCYMIQSFGGVDIGINYGRFGSNLPPPESIPSLVSSLSIKHVKSFDLDPRLTKSLANTGISLSLCIPNHKIPILSSNFTEAESIIRDFILPYHKNTIITSISVGNEVSLLPEFAYHLLPAMVNVERAIRRQRLHQRIKVSTTHSLAILSKRFPPSAATFQKWIAEPVLRPMMEFLKRTNSPIMVNIYPYLAYKQSFPSIPLEFALFSPMNGSKYRYTDPYSGFVYTNLFDVIVGSVNSAMSSLGFPNFPLVVSEIGWPTGGETGDEAANVENARVFNQRLIEHARRTGIPVYIFSLFDEDQKIGEAIEKHWGVMYGNGSKKYDLILPPGRRIR